MVKKKTEYTGVQTYYLRRYARIESFERVSRFGHIFKSIMRIQRVMNVDHVCTSLPTLISKHFWIKHKHFPQPKQCQEGLTLGRQLVIIYLLQYV